MGRVWVEKQLSIEMGRGGCGEDTINQLDKYTYVVESLLCIGYG
jgi:hypothetical protein